MLLGAEVTSRINRSARGGILESFISAFSSQIFTLWQAIKVMGWDSIIAECRTLKRPKFCIFCTIYLKCRPSFEWPLVAILLTCLPASPSIMEVRGQRHVKISWVPENLVAHCIDQKTFSNVRFTPFVHAFLWGLILEAWQGRSAI